MFMVRPPSTLSDIAGRQVETNMVIVHEVVPVCTLLTTEARG